MSSMIREWSSFNDSNIVVESLQDGKNLFLKGIFIQADKRNLNERVYPLNEISAAVMDMNSRIQKTGGILGECDHPDTLTINIQNVSHIITEMHMQGVNGVGTLKMLPYPKGEVIRALIESGVKLGVSSRGSGNVDFNGLVSDFEIVTVDVVAQPSAPDAYPAPIFESLYSKGGYFLSEHAKYASEEILKGNDKARQDFQAEIHDFFKRLRSEQ